MFNVLVAGFVVVGALLFVDVGALIVIAADMTVIVVLVDDHVIFINVVAVDDVDDLVC